MKPKLPAKDTEVNPPPQHEDEPANPPRSARESLLGLVATAEANVAAEPANMREVNRLHALRECLGFFPED